MKRLFIFVQIVIFQIIKQTLTPTWNQLILINNVSLYGGLDEIVQDPPLVVIEVYDDDAVVRKAHSHKYTDHKCSTSLMVL